MGAPGEAAGRGTAGQLQRCGRLCLLVSCGAALQDGLIDYHEFLAMMKVRAPLPLAPPRIAASALHLHLHACRLARQQRTTDAQGVAAAVQHGEAWAGRGVQGADHTRSTSGKLAKGRQATRVAKAKSLLSGVFRRRTSTDIGPVPSV